jgi:hypothetical protein
VSSQADARARRFEQTVRRERHREFALIIDNETGQVIGDRIRGGRRAVEFTPEQLESMRGRILSHNHPDGWRYPVDDPRHKGASFSVNDARMLVDWGVAEIRAVTPGYLHRIRPPSAPDARYHRHLAWATPSIVLHAVVTAFSHAETALEQKVLVGDISPEEATANLNHEAMLRLMEEWGLEYEREVLP